MEKTPPKTCATEENSPATAYVNQLASTSDSKNPQTPKSSGKSNPMTSSQFDTQKLTIAIDTTEPAVNKKESLGRRICFCRKNQVAVENS